MENGYPEIKFDENSYWWKWYNQFIEEANADSEEMYYLLPQFGNSSADSLAMLRDSLRLMYDLAENPEWVKRSINTITDNLISAFNILWRKIDSGDMEGYTNGFGCWSPRKTIGVDADISGMVSPEQFNEIFLPSIVKQMQTVEYRQFHLDGEALAKAHLDTLLSLDELQAIQWVPGDGRTEIMQWLPLIKKIQDKKKSILVYATPEEVMALLKEVRPEGLCISTGCKSEGDARKLIESINKMF
jgi:hypothetical protein